MAGWKKKSAEADYSRLGLLLREPGLDLFPIRTQLCFDLCRIASADSRQDFFVFGVHFRSMIADVVQRDLNLMRRQVQQGGDPVSGTSGAYVFENRVDGNSGSLDFWAVAPVDDAWLTHESPHFFFYLPLVRPMPSYLGWLVAQTFNHQLTLVAGWKKKSAEAD